MRQVWCAYCNDTVNICDSYVSHQLCDKCYAYICKKCHNSITRIEKDRFTHEEYQQQNNDPCQV